MTLSFCSNLSAGTPETAPRLSHHQLCNSKVSRPSWSHPASVVGESVQLIVGDEVRLEVLLPVADALHPVVRVAVDVDRAAEVVRRPAVRLVDRDLLLVGVAHRHARDVLLARELPGAAPDVVARVFSDAADEPGLEQEVAVLREVERSGHRAPYGHRVLSCGERAPQIYTHSFHFRLVTYVA